MVHLMIAMLGVSMAHAELVTHLEAPRIDPVQVLASTVAAIVEHDAEVDKNIADLAQSVKVLKLKKKEKVYVAASTLRAASGYREPGAQLPTDEHERIDALIQIYEEARVKSLAEKP